MSKATFIVKLGIIDPLTNEMRLIDVYKESSGKLVGIDSEFIAYTGPDEPILSPYGNGTIDIDD